MTTFSWSPTCTSSIKSLGGVPDYADSSLPLLGPLADMNSSFELDFVAGRCIDKHKKLVPYKTSGVRVDDIKAPRFGNSAEAGTKVGDATQDPPDPAAPRRAPEPELTARNA